MFIYTLNITRPTMNRLSSPYATPLLSHAECKPTTSLYFCSTTVIGSPANVETAWCIFLALGKFTNCRKHTGLRADSQRLDYRVEFLTPTVRKSDKLRPFQIEQLVSVPIDLLSGCGRKPDQQRVEVAEDGSVPLVAHSELNSNHLRSDLASIGRIGVLLSSQ